MPQFTVEYGKAGSPPLPDGRLDAPAFHRNHEAIWQALAPVLDTVEGHVLELGSGTGQHAAAFAGRTPHLTWWPSDYQASHLASIEAWRKYSRLANLRAPQSIDLGDAAWTWRGDGGELTAILCINVLHISPWRVSENFIRGAVRLLEAGGRLFVYGPFKRDGAHTVPSNVAFDASLRAANPDWGVRDAGDLDRLAQAAGFSPVVITQMPTDNLVLAFTRDARSRSESQ